MTQILQINADELQSIVKQCFKDSINEIKNLPEQSEPIDRIFIDEVSSLIGLRKSVIYKMTCENSIPFKKYSKRLVFSRKSINEWMESRTSKPRDKKTIMAEHLANEANKKTI
ncbi:MAG: helix-turn-helix domain-containing protein [Bacteroidales bacterium]